MTKEGTEGDGAQEARAGELLWGCGSALGGQDAPRPAGHALQGTLRTSPTELAGDTLGPEIKQNVNSRVTPARVEGKQRTQEVKVKPLFKWPPAKLNPQLVRTSSRQRD